MAARIAPDEAGAKRQSLRHFVAKAPWDETKLIASVRTFVLPVMEKTAPIRAWIVDDTGIPKKGKRSVGVMAEPCFAWTRGNAAANSASRTTVRSP
jgi:SRSO17 transposase